MADLAALEVDGQRQSRVTTLALEPRGGAVKAQKSHPETGEASVDADGNRIIRMKSEPR